MSYHSSNFFTSPKFFQMSFCLVPGFRNHRYFPTDAETWNEARVQRCNFISQYIRTILSNSRYRIGITKNGLFCLYFINVEIHTCSGYVELFKQFVSLTTWDSSPGRVCLSFGNGDVIPRRCWLLVASCRLFLPEI